MSQATTSRHLLVGSIDEYPPLKLPLLGSSLQSSGSSSQYVKLSDISTEWDIITLEAGIFNYTTPGATLGGLSSVFGACFSPSTDCPDNEAQEQFTDAVKDRVGRGGSVQLSFGMGFGKFTTAADTENFVLDVRNLVQKYGFNGVNVDLWITACVSGETADFTRPTDFTSIALITALQKLRSVLGSDFTLSISTSFAFSSTGALDAATSCLGVVHALRDVVDFVVVYPVPLYANTFIAPNGHNYTSLDADYWVAAADIAIDPAGMPVYNSTANFPALPANKTFIYLMSPGGADPTSDPARIVNAMNCITVGDACGTYRPRHGTYADFLGFYARRIQLDELIGGPFRTQLRTALDAVDKKEASITTSTDRSTATSTPTLTATSTSARGRAAAIAVPVVIIALVSFAAALWFFRHRRNRATNNAWQAEPFDVSQASMSAALSTSPRSNISPDSSRADSSVMEKARRPRGLAGDSSLSSPIQTQAEPQENIVELRSALQRAGFSFGALLASLNRVHDTRDSDGTDVGAPPLYHDGP